MLYLDSNQSQLALVLANALKSDRGKRVVLSAGGNGDFTVDSTSGDIQYQNLTPQLTITAVGSDPESAQRSVNALVEFARTILDTLQLEAKVPPENKAWITSTVESQAGERLPTNGARRAAACAVGAILAGVVLILLSDAFLERRRGRNRSQNRSGFVGNDMHAPTRANASGVAERDRLTPQPVGPAAAALLSPRRGIRTERESATDTTPPRPRGPATAPRNAPP
jgi:hypothetical protein